MTYLYVVLFDMDVLYNIADMDAFDIEKTKLNALASLCKILQTRTMSYYTVT